MAGGTGGKLTPDASVFFRVCLNLGINVVRDEEERRGELSRRIEEADAIVDALLGTGIRGEVRPRALELIRLVNEHRRGAVVAVDVPSGADTDTGALLPEAIRADWTVTFAYPKWCHYLRPAAERCGEVIVADIGIPRSAAEHRPPAARVNDPSWWREWLRPRSRWSHKGTYGHLLVVGGSRGMLGAAVLAGMAGLRVGAGLSTMAVPAGQEPILAAKVTDALVWGWPDDGEGRFAADSARVLPERVDRFTAAAVGPGLGRFSGEGAWLRELLETLPCSVGLGRGRAEHPGRTPRCASLPERGNGPDAPSRRNGPSGGDGYGRGGVVPSHSRPRVGEEDGVCGGVEGNSTPSSPFPTGPRW